MTDKEYKRQIKRLRKLDKKWIRPIGLGWWRIKTIYQRVPFTEGDIGALAKTETQWEYLQATITWDMNEVERTSDDYLEYAFVHELCHVFLNEMHAEGVLHEERVATSLAHALRWAREAGEKSGK